MWGKFKNFFKYNSVAVVYLLLFVLSQTIIGFGVLFHKIMNDFEFGDKFLEVLMPYYDNPNNMVALEQYPNFYIDYMELLSELLIPIILLSNLAIVFIIGIKILITRKNENLFKKISISNICKYLFLGILLNIVISFIVSLLPMELIEDHASNTEALLVGNPIILFLSAGVLAPLAEELIFRYGMLKNLIKINPIFAIIYQALLFGLLHGNIVQSSYAFVLGLIFGIIVYKKGNVLLTILMHIGINASSVLTVILGMNEMLCLALIMIVMFILFLIFNKIEKNKGDL